jgi:sulfate adenylyltransferase
MLDGALPARYLLPSPGVLVPTLFLPEPQAQRLSPHPARDAATAEVDLLDPEGVTLATVTVDALRDGWVAGSVRAQSGFSIVDHLALRRTPAEASLTEGDAPVWALWAPTTHAVRLAARTQAEAAGATILELVPVPTGRETSRAANAPVRLAAAATTRRSVDRLVVIPVPPLPWDAPGLGLRAALAAAYGADELMVVPGLVDDLPADPAVPLRPVDVDADQSVIPDELLDAWVLEGTPLPSWAAEPPVAAELRRVHRPTSRTGLTVLLSGLSGSGKSTVARALAVRLVEHESRSVSLLDGDVVRHHLSKGLGFSRPDRITNVLRIGFVASEVTKAGGVAVCCPIAPYDETRREVRAMVEEHGMFVLVHVATPLAECERRDRKGLYAKARRGEIPEFTGISDPYEEPTDAEVVIDTTGRTIDDCVDEVYDTLVRMGAVVP